MDTLNSHTIPPQILVEMEAAAERLLHGDRDPERVRESRRSMDRIREEIRQKQGVLDIGVPAIRELRDP